jgi:hypothetical protein
MKRLLAVCTLLIAASCWAAGQAGTNAAHSQQETKSRTGNAGEIMYSPDVNAAIGGYTGSTLGATGDIGPDGTNIALGQQETKPRSGRSAENMQSPDVNAAIGGYTGSTLGSRGDIYAQNLAAVAGHGLAASDSTAMVSDRTQMEKQFLLNEAARQNPGGQATAPAVTSREQATSEALANQRPGPAATQPSKTQVPSLAVASHQANSSGQTNQQKKPAPPRKKNR